MDEMRKAFEADQAKGWHPMSPMLTRDGDGYKDKETNGDWATWQAAWQAATMAERARAERICRNEAEQNYDISRHAWGRLEGCADMIRDGDLP